MIKPWSVTPQRLYIKYGTPIRVPRTEESDQLQAKAEALRDVVKQRLLGDIAALQKVQADDPERFVNPLRVSA